MDLNKLDITLFNKACDIIDSARQNAYRQINLQLVKRNWELGQIIAEDIMNHQERAEYGSRTIANLATELTKKYGKGFNRRDLYNYLSFFKQRPSLFANNQAHEIVHSVSAQFRRELKPRNFHKLKTL